MNRFIQFLLLWSAVTFVSLAQNRAPQFNPTTGALLPGGSMSPGVYPNFLQEATDIQDIANVDPRLGKWIKSVTPPVQGFWTFQFPSSETQDPEKGVIDSASVAGGQWIRDQGGSTAPNLVAGKLLATDTNKNAVTIDANVQTITNAAIQVATVAAMRALDSSQLADGQLIQTGGRLSNGDGGGLLFKYVAGSSATTNLGTVFSFASGTGRTVWVGGSELPAEAFGAVGDGATPDANAINALNEWAGANNVVSVLSREYYVTNTIRMFDNNVLEGKGVGKIIRAFAGPWDTNGFPDLSSLSNVNYYTVQNRNWIPPGYFPDLPEVPEYNTNLVVRGLTFDNADLNIYTNGGHIGLSGVGRVLIEKNTVNRCYVDWALRLFGNDGKVTGNTVLNGPLFFEDGIHIMGGRRWVISDNNGTSGDDFIALIPSHNHPISDVVAVGNVGKSFQGHLVRIGVGRIPVPYFLQTNRVERIIVNDTVGTVGLRNGGVFIEDNLIGGSGTNYAFATRDITVDGLKLTFDPTLDTGGVTNGRAIITRGGQNLTIRNISSTNGVGSSFILNSQNVTLQGINTRNTNSFNLYAEGIGGYLNIIDCDFLALGSQDALGVYGTQNAVISGGQISGNGTVGGLRWNGGTGNLTVRGTRFYSSTVGIRLDTTPGSLNIGESHFETSVTTPVSGTAPTLNKRINNKGVDDITGPLTAWSVTATNATFGDAAAVSPPVTVNGGASGTTIMDWIRSGTSQRWGVSLGTGVWNLINKITSRNVLAVDDALAGNNRVTLGATTGSATPQTGIVRAEIATGTDTAGSRLRLQAGAGTGAGVTSGAYIGFEAPTLGSSGTASQTMAERVAFYDRGAVFQPSGVSGLNNASVLMENRSTTQAALTDPQQTSAQFDAISGKLSGARASLSDIHYYPGHWDGTTRRVIYPALIGRATLVGGSVVVSLASVTTNSNIQVTRYASGGTVGHLNTGTRSAGVSFTITSSSGTDTSTIDWVVIEP